MLRILIAVGEKSDLDEAVRVVEEAGHHPVATKTFDQALKIIRPQVWEALEAKTGTSNVGIDGVLTDIRYPLRESIRETEKITATQMHEENLFLAVNDDFWSPSGAILTAICEKLGIPVKVCTKDYPFASQTGEALNVVVVNDTREYDWPVALSLLVEEIKRRRA